jgi:hypothetical protein
MDTSTAAVKVESKLRQSRLASAVDDTTTSPLHRAQPVQKALHDGLF